MGVKLYLHPLKRITVLQKNWGFGDIFSFWFFIIKLFSETRRFVLSDFVTKTFMTFKTMPHAFLLEFSTQFSLVRGI